VHQSSRLTGLGVVCQQDGAVYCGLPAANHAFRVAGEVLASGD
jgi:hypothetical protein